MARYALRIDAVRGSIGRLIQQRIHQHTIGYLAVRYMLKKRPRTVPALPDRLDGGSGLADGRAPVRYAVVNADIVAFFREFVAVPGGHERYPFYRPFTDVHQATLGHGWMNANVSGSYAPQSLRLTGFGAVVEPAGGTRGRTLLAFKEGYVDLIHTQFLNGGQLPAVDVAVYLYRDFAFQSDATPSAGDLLAIFRSDFGYDGLGTTEYSTLFSESDGGDAPLFEPLPLPDDE